MAARTFNAADEIDAAAEARARFPGVFYAPIRVKVITRDGDTVTLETPNAAPSPVTVKCEWGPEMWTQCPSSLSGPTPGEEGDLYVTAKFLDLHGLIATPKWPDGRGPAISDD